MFLKMHVSHFSAQHEVKVCMYFLPLQIFLELSNNSFEYWRHEKLSLNIHLIHKKYSSVAQIHTLLFQILFHQVLVQKMATRN